MLESINFSFFEELVRPNTNEQNKDLRFRKQIAACCVTKGERRRRGDNFWLRTSPSCWLSLINWCHFLPAFSRQRPIVKSASEVFIYLFFFTQKRERERGAELGWFARKMSIPVTLLCSLRANILSQHIEMCLSELLALATSCVVT